jgi:hypothetical protein
MATEKQWTDAARRLLDMTKDGAIAWKDHNGASRPEAIGPVHTTEALNRVIAVYEFEYPHYDPDTDTSAPTRDVAIEFVTSNGELEYRWPKTAFHWALLDAVRFNVSNVQNFLDEFLK